MSSAHEKVVAAIERETDPDVLEGYAQSCVIHAEQVAAADDLESRLMGQLNRSRVRLIAAAIGANPHTDDTTLIDLSAGIVAARRAKPEHRHTGTAYAAIAKVLDADTLDALEALTAANPDGDWSDTLDVARGLVSTHGS